MVFRDADLMSSSDITCSRITNLGMYDVVMDKCHAQVQSITPDVASLEKITLRLLWLKTLTTSPDLITSHGGCSDRLDVQRIPTMRSYCASLDPL